MDIRFEWSEAKAEANLRKHGVSFQLAQRVFADPLAIVEQDRIEENEVRWKTIGMVEGIQLLVVAHLLVDLEDGGELVRLISARKADKRDWRRYEREAR